MDLIWFFRPMKIYAIGILEWNIELINPSMPPPTQTKTTCPPIQTSPPIWFSKKSVHHIILASKKKIPPPSLRGGEETMSESRNYQMLTYFISICNA